MVVMGRLGPYSTHLRALSSDRLDGRTREARVLKATRNELIKLLGRSPNAGELAFIERLAWLQLRLAALDRKLLDGDFTEFDASVYNAHVNSFGRALVKLGVLGGKPGRAGKAPLTVGDILAKRVA